MKKFKVIICLVLAVLLFSSVRLPLLKVGAVIVQDYPSGICVTYYDGIDSRGFAWQTSTTISETKLLVAKGIGNNADWANAVTIMGTYKDFNGYRLHKAQICDLEEGEYSYRVGGNNVISEIGTFKVDLTKDEKVRFVYVTDSQETSVEGFENWKKTLDTATNLANPDFIAFAGDLVDNSHAGWGSDMSKVKMEEWSYAFDVPKQVIMNYPFMSVAGNHESAGFTFVDHSNIKYEKEASTGGYYSFVYDNLHFIGLDTNAIYNDTAFNEQLAWLESELASSTSNWKVIMLHMGAYSTGDHSLDSESVKIRNLIPPICAKYNVDLVLQGHDHVYTRTMPYYYGEGENGKIPNRTKPVEKNGLMWSIEPDGTYYVTINYAGTKSYPPVEYDTGRIFPAESPVNGKQMSQHIKNRMFADVQIDGNTLIFNSYLALDDGSYELYDYFAVEKNTHISAVELIDALPETVTPRDSVALKQAKDAFDVLTERAILKLGSERSKKLENLLRTFDLQSGLNAYEVICAIDLLDINNVDANFYANYASAKNAYYTLSDGEKDLVVNAEKLLSIESTITNKFLVEKVQQLVDKFNKSGSESDRIIALEAYNLLDADSKNLISVSQKLFESSGGGKVNLTWIIVASVGGVAVLLFVILFIIKKRGKSNEN